ncbi:LysR substrate-binding domain-containing protein [Mesorhizobium sp. M0904]|uniref:LysR substrate-binding domain-containing protein n=1 Tax=Mesorhizobium sp. M0904 TaxID=2957022 RepID=UPI00333D73ED
MQRLPSLRALRAFEAAGRRLSFTRAAEELNVSPGAISHQISILEQELKFPLFKRLSGGIALTDKGKKLLATLTRAFSDIATSVEDLSGHQPDLHIRVQPLFMARWLLPRMHDFQKSNPDIKFKITTSISPLNVNSNEFDAAILTMQSPPAGLISQLLMDERTTPVCSPAFLEANGPFTSPGQLLSYPIIKVRMPEDSQREDGLSYWQKWLKDVGEVGDEPDSAQEYDTLDAALIAACRGFGIAMADYNFVGEELADGRLVMPFDLIVDQGLGYYLVISRESVDKPEMEAFRRWLSRELGDRDIAEDVAPGPAGA